MNKIIHYHSYEHERKIPRWEENKLAGLKATLCGYQRKNATSDKNKVTCSACLQLIKEREGLK